MTKVKINSVVKLYTLCLLNNGPKHGYEIIKELENSMNRNISTSHIYPFLKSLENNNVIQCHCIEEREKKKYSLTKNGKDFVEVVFNKLGGLIDAVIENKLSSCEHCQCRVYEGGYTDVINHKRKYFCCEHCAKIYKAKLLLVQ